MIILQQSFALDMISRSNEPCRPGTARGGAPVSATQEMSIRSVLDTWSTAELAADVATLDDVLAEDFAGVGPFGFTLDRWQWLDRHHDRALVYRTFALEDAEISVHGRGNTGVVRGRQVAEGAYRGRAVPSEHRATIVLDRQDDDGWKLVALQLSFILGTPGAPAMPGV